MEAVMSTFPICVSPATAPRPSGALHPLSLVRGSSWPRLSALLARFASTPPCLLLLRCGPVATRFLPRVAAQAAGGVGRGCISSLIRPTLLGERACWVLLPWPSLLSGGAGAFTPVCTLPHRAHPRRVTIPRCGTLRALLRRAQNGVVSVCHRKDHRPQTETRGHH
jgi:hypothetical protein